MRVITEGPHGKIKRVWEHKKKSKIEKGLCPFCNEPMEIINNLGRD
jgi:hypothetical protein